MKNCLILLAALLLLSAPLAAGSKIAGADHQISQWHGDAGSVKDSLRAGNYKKAEHQVNRLLSEVNRRMVGGEGAARLIGLLLTLRAVSEVGLDREEDGLWSWQLAQRFEPVLARVDLSEYGEPGRWLNDQSLESERPSYDTSRKDQEPSFERPKAIQRTVPEAPGALRSHDQEAATHFAVTIDTDGSVSNPEVLSGPANPVFVLAAVDEARNWRFEPCQFDGEPVACRYRVSTDFSRARATLYGSRAGNP